VLFSRVVFGSPHASRVCVLAQAMLKTTDVDDEPFEREKKEFELQAMKHYKNCVVR
jgi:hypothetical protein